MKQFRIIGALVLVSAFTSSCIIDDIFDCIDGRGERVEEEFGLDRFDEVRLSIDADVYITQEDDHRVRIVAQQNIIDELNFRIRNRSLTIGDHHCIRSHDKIEIYISMSEIERLSISGSGTIRGENIFQVNDIELQVSGSGNLDLGIEGDDIEGRISGSGDMILEGKADSFDYSVSGSGDLSSFDFEVRKAHIQISGSGDAEVFVTDILDVRISGSGDVWYKGDPSIDSRISGSGRIIDAN